MEFKKRDKNDNFSIDIAPLVDVVFLLLIFFMVSTTFEVNTGLKVDLPTSSSKEIKKEPETINISVTKSGEIYYNGGKIDIVNLNAKFQNLKNKESLIIIKADKFSYHGTVVSIMDLAKKNGLNNLAIATKQDEQ